MRCFFQNTRKIHVKCDSIKIPMQGTEKHNLNALAPISAVKFWTKTKDCEGFTQGGGEPTTLWGM